MSCLDLEAVVAEVGKDFPGQVATSEDPGRFICNYIYWTSLGRCGQHPSDPQPESQSALESRSNPKSTLELASVFIHVPEFKDLPQPRQLEILLRVLKCLVAQFRRCDVDPLEVGEEGKSDDET